MLFVHIKANGPALDGPDLILGSLTLKSLVQ